MGYPYFSRQKSEAQGTAFRTDYIGFAMPSIHNAACRATEIHRRYRGEGRVDGNDDKCSKQRQRVGEIEAIAIVIDGVLKLYTEPSRIQQFLRPSTVAELILLADGHADMPRVLY